MYMIKRRGKKSDVRVKLTDRLINYAMSGKNNNEEWQRFNNALVDIGGVIRDSDLVGFQVVRTSSGKVSFRYDYRLHGKRRNITLGQFPKITVTQARALAKEKSLIVANGKSPLDQVQIARDEVSNTLKNYLKNDYSLYMHSRAIQAQKYLNIISNGFPELLKLPLTEISKADLVKWGQFQTEQHNLNVKGYASATIIQRHGALKSLMSHAVRNGAIENNPFDRLDKLEFTTTSETTQQQAKRTYLTLDQQQAFLKSVDAYDEKIKSKLRGSRVQSKSHLAELDNLAFASHHKPMLLILYYMGLRMGDVVSLEWTHVIDTQATCNITKVLEKTRRKIKIPFVMPMPEPVRSVLACWHNQQGNPVSGLVFPNYKGGRLGNMPLRNCWVWIKKNAEFHDDLELYTLRHNFISWLIMNNVPLPVIAGMVGHVSTDMINRNYGHLIAGATTDASKGFAALLESQE